ncbi:uncharacterized protein LOC130801160 [Amaranthus tricolor]|uniref:uncharacterized protein LOC130801160 n=1 Tax=Amaranthus tricolor TaxID=29722 RepID=UPI00258E8FEB|nr:uncharacterized protein LOC130801160 [Amaranthus tricolor]
MARKTGRQPKKGNFKTDFRKAMIAAWGDTESEAETEVPVEEETANLCLMVSHHSKDEESKEKEVMSSSSFPKHLFKFNKYKLIKLLLETQEKLDEQNTKCLQIEKDLNSSKDHVSYLNSFKIDVQSRIFNLLDQNIILKETLEKMKLYYS